MKQQLTRKEFQEKVEYVLNLLNQVNTITEELENTLTETTKKNVHELSEIFDDIRQNQMHDIKDIMMKFDELGVLDELSNEDPTLFPFDVTEETIHKVSLKMEAINVIKEAIAAGVLEAAGSRRVYVCVSEDGTEENSYWKPILLDEAASSLVENGCVEMLKKAVEKAKE